MTADTVTDPRKSGTYRVMLAVVIILGVLIVAAFGALVVGGIMKAAGHKAAAAAEAPAALSAQLPADAKIIAVETTANRVVLTVHTPRGDEVDIFDTDTGRPVARIAPVEHGLSK